MTKFYSRILALLLALMFVPAVTPARSHSAKVSHHASTKHHKRHRRHRRHHHTAGFSVRPTRRPPHLRFGWPAPHARCAFSQSFDQYPVELSYSSSDTELLPPAYASQPKIKDEFNILEV